jgi:prolyl-tRNA synthetase
VDWQTVRADGAIAIDARIVLRSDADELVGMRYRGLRHGPAEVMAQLARGEDVDPADYYFRITCSFSTSAPRLEWLNRVLAIGIGHRLAAGPRYAVHALG